MPPHDSEIKTAIHEAGHATVAVLLRRPIDYVTIERSGNTLGRVVFRDPAMLNMADHREAEREAALHLAGFAAEMILDRHSTPTGCADEILYAYNIAVAIGRDDRGFEHLVWRTTRMLLAIWPCVLAVAAELNRRGTIEGSSLRRLVLEALGLRRRRGATPRPPTESKL